MEFKPHDYQQYAIEYIETHEIAAILLDMGLGKTAITLTALYDLLFDYFEITRVLVIAPLRVARNTWPQEIEKWDHLKDVRYSVAVGTEKERLEAFRRDADIYIINREWSDTIKPHTRCDIIYHQKGCYPWDKNTVQNTSRTSSNWPTKSG